MALVFEREYTVALTAVQSDPEHPRGAKAKLVSGFPMLGFTSQSGDPFSRALTRTDSVNRRSFCVAAI
jgi:hypothetical protein